MKLLSVQAASRLTGISKHSLRAWEKRYKAVTPGRSESGQRRYTEEQVERLKLLRRAVDLGHSISQVASLTNEKLKTLALEGPALALTSNERSTQLLVEEIIYQLKNLNLYEVSRLIHKAKHLYSTKDFVLDIVSPLFGLIGDLVSQGELDISQEHALSTVMKYNLSEILFSLQNNPFYESQKDLKNPVVTLATPEGDLHEFGILATAVLASLCGFNSYYVGPNLPAHSLSWLGNSVQSEMVIIGTSPIGETESGGIKRFLAYLKEIDDSLDAGIEIWVGGSLSQILTSPSPYRHPLRAFETLDQCYAQLSNMT